MSASPRVSVIIPTYNRADRLLVALQSVLSQDYTDYDVWIIDDGGKDNTAEAVRPFLSDRVHLVRKENGGLSSARNVGIRAAGGDYIALLDDDDVCLPGRLRTQAEFLDAHPEVGLHFTDVWKVDIRGKRWRFTETVPQFYAMFRKNGKNGSYVISTQEMLGSILMEKPLKPSAVMMRRQCFDQAGYFDEKLGPGEMLDLVLRLSRVNITFGYTHEPLVDYHIWGGNIGVGSRTKAPRLAIQILEENRRLAHLTPSQAREAVRGIAYQHYQLGLLLDEDGQAGKACAAFSRAFSRDRKLRYLAHAAGSWVPKPVLRGLKRLRQKDSGMGMPRAVSNGSK